MLVIVALPAAADEADDFTCRSQLTVDAQPVFDRRVNDLIELSVARANRKPGCDEDCLARELRREVGGSAPAPPAFIPHSRLALWAMRRTDIDRCRLRFRDSIYGARPYHHPWLFPFTRRVIFLADSILLSGRVAGLDKIDHFVREGRKHYDDVERGGSVAETMRAALGRPARPFAMTEYGLRGRALTGVVSYADLAASYSGFLFWRDLLTLDRPSSLLARQRETSTYVVRRPFTFADYVTDAWDEAINRSDFQPQIGRAVADALRARGAAPLDCRRLASLPDAPLYVNPGCWRDDYFARSL